MSSFRFFPFHSVNVNKINVHVKKVIMENKKNSFCTVPVAHKLFGVGFHLNPLSARAFFGLFKKIYRKFDFVTQFLGN